MHRMPLPASSRACPPRSPAAPRQGRAGLAASRRAWVEDGVGADASPDYVRGAWALPGSVLPGGAPVRGPGHLEYSRRALHALDPQPRPEPAGVRVRDELGQHDLPEPFLLRGGQPRVVPAEPG